jgi:Fe-S-cluster containining protein
VYVTLEDRRRLAAHLGMATQQFTKRYCTREDGHIHLNEPEKDCFFLVNGRCRVYEARPTQCRGWPFWPENMKKDVWEREIVPNCPGVGKGRLYTADEIRAILREQEDVPSP